MYGLLPIAAAMRFVHRSGMLNEAKKVNPSKFICYSNPTANMVFYMTASASLCELSDYSSADFSL